MTSSHVPVWIPSAMLLDLTYWATRRNKHAAILIGGTLIGLSIPLFNMINLLLVRDPLEVAFKYPRPTLPPYMTPIEPQVGKFYNSPVALGAGAGAVLTVPIADVRCETKHVDLQMDGQRGVNGTKIKNPFFSFLCNIASQGY